MSDIPQDKQALRASIEESEAHLKQALGTLKHSIKSEVQVGPRVAKTPYRVLGICVAIGFVLGILPAATSTLALND